MRHLKEAIANLYQSHGLIMLKGGTEWEDMDFNEIEYLNSLCSPKTPLLIKVAGPEARVDIRNLMPLNVGGILGPMIESEYALEKFITTVQDIYKAIDKKPILAVNIETKCGADNLESILNSRYCDFVDLIVIGRLDLSASFAKQNVDDDEVADTIKHITDQIQKKGIKVSLGGFVNPQSALIIQKQFNVDRINTIHALFDLKKAPDITESIRYALEFEIKLYKAFKQIKPKRAAFYDTRIDITQKKLKPDGS